MNNVEGTVNGYVSWILKFESWRERTGVEPSLKALRTFDEFLCDTVAVQELVDSIDGSSPWNLARPPDNDENRYSYTTRKKAASALKSWFRFEYDVSFPEGEEGDIRYYIDGDPEPFDPVVAELHEVAEVFDDVANCNAVACEAMTRVGYDAMTRVSELVSLRWDDYNSKNRRIYVEGAMGSANRWIELDQVTVDILEDYRDYVKTQFADPEWLFYSFFRTSWNQPWRSAAYSNHFKRHWEAGTHSFFRHTSITHALDNGASITDVKERARHKNISTTSRCNAFTSNAVVRPELQHLSG
jgi:integrase